MSSCEKPSLESEEPGAALNSGADQKVETKGNGKNPFSVANMREAYANLVASPQPCPDCGPATEPQLTANVSPAPVEATHLYVRFKPANTDQIADLGDLGYRLSWEPYDEDAAVRETVNYSSDEIPWIYTVVPKGSYLPSYIQQEQLEELYLFSTEDGDTRDEVQDPWEPTPEPPPSECQTQYDSSCGCYHDCPVQLAGGSTTATKKPNKQKEEAKKLKKARMSPKALYEEALRISGHTEEMATSTQPTSTNQSLFGTRYKPNGKILVQDTELGPVALRGVRVESRRWFNFDYSVTSNTGTFTINSGYLNKVKLSLEFKNDLATTRGLSNAWKPWQAVLPINYQIGVYEKTAMQSVAYMVSAQTQPTQWDSRGLNIWAAATTFNALADAQTFATARGLPPPVKAINIWIFPTILEKGSRVGSAPMLRRIAETSLASRFIDALLAATGLAQVAIIKQVIQRQLPDMTLYYANKTRGAFTSQQLTAMVYHELGHTQHYNQVGNDFWTAYIAHILLNAVDDNPYGRKSASGSGRLAISEGWGNYVERLFQINRYQTPAPDLSRAAASELENQIPTDVGDGWFVYGMYHDMTDPGEPPFTGVRDNVTAYTPATVFRGLRYDVTTVRGYQAKVNAQNNNAQAAQLNTLVTDYRW